MWVRSGGSAHSLLAIAGLAVVGVVVTAAVSIARLVHVFGEDRHSIGVITVDDLHEGQVEAAAAMVLTLIAAVLLARVRRLPTRSHLLLFTALCLLAFDNLVSALFTAGFDSLSANRFALWATIFNGLIGVLLLVAAAWLPDVSLRDPGRSLAVAAAAGALVVAVSMSSAWILRDSLPDAFQDRPTTPRELTFLSEHPMLMAIEAVTAACWVAAAVLFARNSRRTGDELTWWLALAAVLAAVSMANYVLFPSQLVELLYLGDYFFMAAVAVLLIGSVREIGAAEAALVDNALYDERRRIAREMHGGVAQELAFIASQTDPISSRPTSAGTLPRIHEAAERALDQQRAAIRELSGPVHESLAQSIAVTADVITRRAGVRLDVEADEAVEVGADARRALLGITQVAVAGAVRRADAGHVEIELWRNGVVSGLRIVDDGARDDLASRRTDGEMALIHDRVAAIPGYVELRTLADGRTCLEVRWR